MGGPTWQALIADLATKQDLGRVMGLIGTLTLALSTPAPFIGGYLYDTFSPSLPLQLGAVTAVAAILVMLLFSKELSP